MAKSPTSDVIRLGTATAPVRLSFARLYNAKPFAPGQTPRFEAAFLLDPSNKEHAATISTIRAAAKALIEGAKLDPKDFKLCFGKGDTKKYDGYQGMVYLTSSNTTRPTVVNRNRNAVAEGDPQAPYSGSFVIGTITLWLQNNSFGKRINANLRAVQFVKDGPAFGAQAPDAESEFEALGDSAEGSGGKSDFDDDIAF